jgi:hypothetical protein
MRGLFKYCFLLSTVFYGQKPNDIAIIEVIEVIFPSSIETDPFRNLSFYKESISNEYFTYSKYQDKKEAKKLFRLIRKLKTHPKTKRNTIKSHFGDNDFSNMFVVQYNSFKDTFSYAVSKNLIFYKNEEYFFEDKNQRFKKIFNKVLKPKLGIIPSDTLEFYLNLKENEISANEIKFQNKVVSKMSKDEVKEIFGPFISFVKDCFFYENTNDSSVQEEECMERYFAKNGVFTFSDQGLKNLEVDKYLSEWEINQCFFKIGDDVASIKQHFKNSIKKINFFNSHPKVDFLKLIVDTIEIPIKEDVGAFYISIKKNKIASVSLHLR